MSRGSLKPQRQWGHSAPLAMSSSNMVDKQDNCVRSSGAQALPLATAPPSPSDNLLGLESPKSVAATSAGVALDLFEKNG